VTTGKGVVGFTGRLARHPGCVRRAARRLRRFAMLTLSNSDRATFRAQARGEVRMSEFDQVRPAALPGSRIFAGGIAVLVLGTGPLLLYILLGPADGNPIGLGLLAVVAVPIGSILAGLGLLKMLIALLVGQRG
jgi:hypothetical protein